MTTDVLQEDVLQEIVESLEGLADAETAKSRQWFFKTGPGEYGAGDRFRGIVVPELRKLSRKYYRKLDLPAAEKLLHSEYHEDRLLALFLLVLKYGKADEPTQEQIYKLYLDNTTHINNWDMVDSSAEQIVGAFLADKPKDPLTRLALSDSLWERRIAIMATYHEIKQDRFDETLRIAEMLLHDEEDLIHKAVGWMFREISKRDLATEEAFLHRHYQQMPRTMLRYAIEKFPKPKRQAYLKGEIEPST